MINVVWNLWRRFWFDLGVVSVAVREVLWIWRDKVALLDAGADDFVTKPIGENERRRGARSAPGGARRST